MNEWTLGSFLSALVLVILGGAAVGFVAQRTLFKNFRFEDPIKTLKRRERNKFHNSLGVLAGLAVVLLIYPLSCRLSVDLNVFGLSDEMLTFLIILAGGLLVPLYLSWRNKNR
ncbi:MAG: hypothetical protein Q8M09_14625 [Pseudomonadota bacterium]|nr:hypothetical protein [Pseudomonadota bacterium]MDP1905460.1 hypothetical protein [Pseudomonadota bacterium]MDP2351069.1 hypothetical protein [Pseudomonadota bacterium]